MLPRFRRPAEGPRVDRAESWLQGWALRVQPELKREQVAGVRGPKRGEAGLCLP